MGYSRRSFVCVAMGPLVALAMVSAAPNPQVDPSRIYTPDDLDELRAAVAYEQCQRDPNCNPNQVFGNPQMTCSIGAGVDGVLRDMVNTRTGGTPKCNPFIGEVVWPATGQCVRVLSQGPCPNGYWVKLSLEGLQPICKPRPCADDQAMIEGKGCNTMEDQSMCPTGQSLLNNEFGTAECDCPPGMAYHSLTQACYTPYSRGPCPEGQIIKVFDSQATGKAECMPNPCPAENMALVDSNCKVQDSSNRNPTGNCYSINTIGPCIAGTFFAIDRVLLEPVCLLHTETHSIFNLPNIRPCHRGSIRDSQGRCRRDFSKVFGRPPPLVTSRPGGQGDGTLCPKGQVILGGFCYRLASSASESS